jgi:hypothetical protein
MLPQPLSALCSGFALRFICSANIFLLGVASPFFATTPVLAQSQREANGVVEASKTIGERVGQRFWPVPQAESSSFTDQGLAAYRARRMATLQAEDLWYHLNSTPPYSIKQKEEHARSLVEFACLCLGKFPSETQHFPKFLATTAEQAGPFGIGRFSPKDGFQFPEQTFEQELDARIFTATMHVIRMLEWYELEEKLDKELLANRNAPDFEERKLNAQKKLLDWNQENSNNTSRPTQADSDAARIALEICNTLFNTTSEDARAIAAKFGVTPKTEIQPVTQPDHAPLQIPESLLSRESNPHSVFNANSYKEKIEKSRKANPPSLSESRGSGPQLPKTSLFGGIKLGHQAIVYNNERCKALTIRLVGNKAFLDFKIERAGRETSFSYGPIPKEKLYAAYHILRPTREMEQLAGVLPAETELLFTENGGSGGVSTMHPALEGTEIAQRMISLELAANRLASEQSVSQWESLPTIAAFDAGKVIVTPQDSRDDFAVGLRCSGSDKRNLNPSTSYEIRKIHQKSKLLTSFEIAKRPTKYLTSEEIENLFYESLNHPGDLTSERFYRGKSLSVIDRLSLDLNEVDAFCRLLSLLYWAQAELVDQFPDWPEQNTVPSFPVRSIRSTPNSQISISPFNDVPSETLAIVELADFVTVSNQPRDLKKIFDHDQTTTILDSDQPKIILKLTPQGTQNESEFVRLEAIKDGEAERFLAETEMFNFSEPSIQTLSKLITEKSDRFEGIVSAINQLRNLLATDLGLPIPTSASLSLAGGRGCCRENGVILTAILRGAGIPARPVGGYVATRGEAFAGAHMWVEAAIDGYWYRVDSAMYGSTASSIYFRFSTFEEGPIEFRVQRIFKYIQLVTPPATNTSEYRVPALQIPLNDSETTTIQKLLFATASAQTECILTDSPTKYSSFHDRLSTLGISTPPNYIRCLKSENDFLMLPRFIALQFAQEIEGLTRQFNSKVAAAYRLPFGIAAQKHLADAFLQSPSLQDDPDLLTHKTITELLKSDLSALDFSELEIRDILQSLSTQKEIPAVLETIRVKIAAPKITMPDEISLSTELRTKLETAK